MRLDETVAIEVEARDPDFALSAVRLRGEAAGRVVLDEPLLKSRAPRAVHGAISVHAERARTEGGRRGGVLGRGDRQSHAEAELTATERKVLRIVSPNPAQQPPPDRIAQNDRQQPQQGEQQGEQGQGDKAAGRAARRTRREGRRAATGQRGRTRPGPARQQGQQAATRPGRRPTARRRGNRQGERAAGEARMRRAGRMA